MDILRITVRWSGFLGAPGYSNFHFASDAGFWDGGVLTPDAEVAAGNANDKVYSGMVSLSSVLPDGVTLDIVQEAEIINSDTGEIVGFVEVNGGTETGSGGTGGWSAASGGVVNWRTSDYRFGRRIRGRTFVVPLAGNAYEGDGTLTNTALGSLRSFAEAVIGAGDSPEFGVWSRPRNGAGGVFATATNFNVPDLAAVLRSRRD